MIYVIVLCIGGSGVEEYNLRKDLVSNKILLKRLDKKKKFFLSKQIDKELLQGNIALLSLKDNLDDVINIIEKLKKQKNYLVLGVFFKNYIFSVEFLMEIQKKTMGISQIINNNILKIYNQYMVNNIGVIKSIKYVNNKSSN